MTDENADAPSVSPEDLHERLARGERVRLLDVRNREEFEAWRIEGAEATQVPYAEFAAAKARGDLGELAADLDLSGPVVAVCPRGEVSATVAESLREEGVDARNLAGGMGGWARVYVASELAVAPSGATATVVQYDRPASGCLSYLVVSEGQAAVVDPLRAFADRYVADAESRGADLAYAVDTHVHADHFSGVRRLAAETDAQAVVPEGARDRGLDFDARLLGDGDDLEVGSVTLTALHAPGHTTELTALVLGEVLFSGDALFLDGYGRPDLERGEGGAAALAETLYDTLGDRLLALPDVTLVAPGHREPAATPREDGTFVAPLGTVRERISLPDDRGAFVSRVLDSLPPRPANYEEIIPANLGTEEVDDDEAFELELGPNNCAVAADD
ncbi:MBL fold metallo-hydrolase [Halorussus salilacus]|uniref:MBL fold metallo-hydrolase n=1 Tax=Halorussus salilacus TaxID=2953750 RepID=UPI0020A173C6|nr:MBL fold metallo-hydrolase [Halorussus salilacus]USZ68985.1 MBL fold metallo-hydrolase [Halorussus salilacus]